MSRRSGGRWKPSFALIILTALLAMLWIAGGASRADVLGQVLTRLAASVALVSLILFGARPQFSESRAPIVLLAGAIGLVAIQLIPLPFDLWSALPGREIIAAAVAASRPWHGIALTPGPAVDALLSLYIPFCVLIAMMALPFHERVMVLPLVLLMIVAAALFGLFQFSVGYFDNPLINDTPWQVNGPFANRNHFALFMALGCLLVPAWAVQQKHMIWSLLAPVLVGFLLLMIFVSGSRAGLLVGAIGTAIGLFLARSEARRRLHHAPRWVLPVLIAATIAFVAILLLFGIHAGRADAINRLFAEHNAAEMRGRTLPTVLALVVRFFPVGSGAGSFDTVFRMHEPFDLLNPTYFNHAHNDFLEIALVMGLPGLLLLVAALIWWGLASTRAWRGPSHAFLPRLGSAMLLLVLIGSAVDYPARTPIIMAMIAIAAVWLSSGAQGKSAAALPRSKQHL